MQNAMELRNQKMGARVAEALQKRHFGAYYVNTADEAAELAMRLIPKEDTVSWGGSMTLQQIGLPQRLKEAGYAVIDRNACPPEEREQAMRDVFSCGTFLCSANAISEDGQLVNLDGNGNRVAALIFGPRQVLVIAGVNKVVKSLSDAVERTRTVAAPINCQRFPGLNTGCRETGVCSDCKSEDSICAQLVVTRLCRPAGRIQVILVGESLGF